MMPGMLVIWDEENNRIDSEGFLLADASIGCRKTM